MNIGSKKLQREIGSAFCGAQATSLSLSVQPRTPESYRSIDMHWKDSISLCIVVIVHIQNCNLTVYMGVATLEHERQFTS
jgi:hypothetical protein